MFRYFVTAFAVLALAFTSAGALASEAQNLHTIIVGDTKDGRIGVGVTANVKKLKSFVAFVRREGGLAAGQPIPGRDVVIEEDSFSCKAIQDAVQALQVGPNDAVLFYYSGHGYRTATTPTDFPDFACGDVQAPGGIMGMSWVAKILDQKHARFAITISDACNTLIESLPPGFEFRAAPGVVRDALRRLFLRYRGRIMMTASKTGTEAWYLNQQLPSGEFTKPGGLFTHRFVSAFNATLEAAAIDPKAARWTTIIADATKPIVFDAEHGQQPIAWRKIAVDAN